MFNFLDKKYKRVCLLGNQHGLFLYLLLSSLEDIHQTFFMWSYTGITEVVIRKFGKQGTVIPKPRKCLTNISIINLLISYIRLFYDYYIYYPLKYLFLLNSKLDYWGHDHVYNAHCILRNHSFHLIEDGTLNYVPFPFLQPNQRWQKLKQLIAGKCFCEYKKYAGSENKCTEIYLTGLTDKGEVLKDPKVKIVSFIELWNHSSLEKRAFINDVFEVTADLITECSKYRHILLTEPLSEMGILSEDEKIDLLRDIIKRIGRNDIVIKPHPREITDYSHYFPNNYVLNTRAPIQLLTLNGVRFEAAYSIFSTALFDFPYKIKVCCIGSEVHPKLYSEWPDWTSDKIKAKISNKNVDYINYVDLNN